MEGKLIFHLLNGLLMIAIPIGVAIFILHKFHLDWRLWWIGAAVFILSQVGHIPFNLLVSPVFTLTFFTSLPLDWRQIITAAFLGLSAGLFEELGRYAMYRWWAKDARAWSRGLLAGAGHGGAEAILLGALALYAFIQLATLRNVDLSKLYSGNELALARQQVQTYWSLSWYDSLAGALERLFALPIQISLAVIVLQAFTRKRAFWVCLAVLYHALIDASSVLAIKNLGVYWSRLGLFAVLSVVIIFVLRQPEPPATFPPDLPVLVPAFTPKPVEETPEKLDDTRFQ